MTSGLEIYNKQGELVLTSEDRFLTYPVSNFNQVLTNKNISGYTSHWVVEPKTKLNMDKALAANNTPITIPTGHVLLIQPYDGITLTYTPDYPSEVRTYIKNLNKNIAKYVTMSLTAVSSNFTSGYLDCFDQQGNLTWSIASLANSIQLADVKSVPTVVGTTFINQPAYIFNVPTGYSPDDFYFLITPNCTLENSVDMPDSQNIVSWAEAIIQRSGNSYYVFATFNFEGAGFAGSTLDDTTYSATADTDVGYTVYVFWKPPTS